MPEPLDTVFRYHEQTKHHLDRYARSPGYLDWANQPDPFRRYEGAPLVELPLPELRREPTCDSLYLRLPEPRPLDGDSISELFFFSLALSAWKQVRGLDGRIQARWSLRVNPSSGNLHPTEAYLVCGPAEGLCEEPAVYHYAPHEHGLELRRRLAAVPGLAPGCALVGFTSIHWREAWKYGERAWRYCQHDCGHAIAAVALSAACLGWRAQLVDSVPAETIARLLGVHTQEGPETEHPDCLLLLTPEGAAGGFTSEGLDSLEGSEWLGSPNRLSPEHRLWPVIDEVAAATASPGLQHPPGRRFPDLPPLDDRGLPAHEIIRRRRSAVAMDGETQMPREAFYRLLVRLMPQPVPYGVLPWPPAVSLALFVHRVADLDAGLYVLVREPAHEDALRRALRPDFLWHRPDGCPPELPLYLLLPADTRQAARTISCHQEIASDGVFSLGMLARFEETLRRGGPAIYPRLFWETGVIGQVLYLEAEAAGLRGTGIGCFFDDAMHATLGIRDRSWQSLYHFTVGGPLEDRRLETAPAYAHLAQRRAGPER